MLQIYKEKIYDLLNNQNKELRIRWNKQEQFSVENLYSIECKTVKEAIDAYNSGIKNRVMAKHKLNISSSRSHTIFTVTIRTECMNQYDNVITGKLQLVDLAGSEKTSQTGNIGEHFKESVDINKSLLALRKVILILSDNSYKENKTFVPYRDSKLTSLLKHCLGGNSFCLMVSLME
jgi:kinesin family protein 4/21/27